MTNYRSDKTNRYFCWHLYLYLYFPQENIETNVVPRETMGKKTKLFVTGNRTKLLTSTTLQSIFAVFQFSFPLHSRPFPSRGDKSLNNEQGRSNRRLQLLSVWRCKVQVTGSDNHGQVTRIKLGTEGSHKGGDLWFTDSLQLLPTSNCCSVNVCNHSLTWVKE